MGDTCKWIGWRSWRVWESDQQCQQEKQRYSRADSEQGALYMWNPHLGEAGGLRVQDQPGLHRKAPNKKERSYMPLSLSVGTDLREREKAECPEGSPVTPADPREPLRVSEQARDEL